MIVQNPADVQKLNFVKERIKDRPLNVSFTQPLPRRTRQTISSSNTVTKSPDDTNSLVNQTKTRPDNLSVSNIVEVLKPNQSEVDLESVRSSELNDGVSDNKSKKNKLKVKQYSQSSTRKFKINRIVYF
jgi:hypothetical protein